MLRSRPLLVTGVVLGLFMPLVLLGGLLVHNVITDALQQSHLIRSARQDVATSLQLQVDEETGLRGFIDTRQKKYLEPYDDGRKAMATTVERLRSEVDQIGGPSRTLMELNIDGASDVNATWLREVATPLITDPAHTDFDAVQSKGKRLVDTFRDHTDAIERALAKEQQAGDDRVTGNVDKIEVVVVLAGLVIVVAGMLYFVDQQRLQREIEAERSRAESEKRSAAELRAAYEAEKRIADTLQDGFSQRPLPDLPTVRFSASYIPATEETRVGGDWYDAVELTDSRVLFTIGDVAGHGLDAAVTMNRARQAVLGSALRASDPAAILERINAEFVRANAPMVTAIVGVADSRTFEFIFATAGHPPPVLVEPGHEPRMLEVGGLPLGVVEGAHYRTTRVQSVPGAVLVLYTDGAVEHSHDVLEGEKLLLEAASKALSVDERDAATVIHRTIFDDRSVGDDVAILTVGFAVDSKPGLVISAEHAQATMSTRLMRGAGASEGVRPPATAATRRVA